MEGTVSGSEARHKRHEAAGPSMNDSRPWMGWSTHCDDVGVDRRPLAAPNQQNRSRTVGPADSGLPHGR